MTEPTQKLARGASHTEGSRTYRGEMPRDMFNALPEKIQGKIKAAVKREEDKAAAVAKSNQSQAEKTETDQAEVAKEKDKKNNRPGK